MDTIQKNAKGLTALIVALLASYLTPEVIQGLGVQAGEWVSAGVVASLTGALVWLVPKKES